jgi:hypothetical protein
MLWIILQETKMVSLRKVQRDLKVKDRGKELSTAYTYSPRTSFGCLLHHVLGVGRQKREDGLFTLADYACGAPFFP